ncbi:MAG: hypothetical protein OER96_03010 [Gammaproteobacteria bacterium]|nr:hypothetical protein [Gammaproteobacteria bacterium]
MLNILIVGGYDAETEGDVETLREFAKNLGYEVIKQGHVLLNSCRTDFDTDVAHGAHEALLQLDPTGVNDRLKAYVPKGGKPLFHFGTLFLSKLTDWDPAKGIDTIPEPIDDADVVIFVRGYEGLNQAAIWSEFAGKPILPVASFDGAAEKLYERELVRFDTKYSGRLDKTEFQVLNTYIDDTGQLANKVVSLAENVLVSKVVAVMRSYSLDSTVSEKLVNGYDIASSAYDYQTEPVTELTSGEGIVGEIHKKIEQSAFMLADFTDLKPNVFYEFGYAQGLGKPCIVTARAGTE